MRGRDTFLDPDVDMSVILIKCISKYLVACNETIVTGFRVAVIVSLSC
jgi:hypothetical protein